MFSAQQVPFPVLIINESLSIIAENTYANNLLKTQKDYLIHKKIFDIFKPINQSNAPVSLNDLNSNADIFAHINLTHYPNKSDTFRLVMHPQVNSKLTWVVISKERYWQQAYYQVDKKLVRLSNTIEASNTGIWQYNRLTEKAEFSAKFKQLIGVDVNKVLTWSGFINKILLEDQIIFNSFIKNHLDALIPLNVEFRILINNHIKWFTLRGDTFFDENQPTILMGTLIDSSNTKAILSELNNAIESKNIAMEVGTIGTWRAELNSNNKWVWSWDKLTSQMFSLQPSDKGQLNKLTDIIHPADKQNVIKALEQSLAIGQLFSQSYRVILPSGEIRYFIAKARVGQDTLGNNYRFDGIFVDETLIQNAQIELKNLNSELEKRVSKRTKELVDSKEKAEKASQIKTDFLAMMSHELRTPMNAVIGSLDLLQSTKQELESKELIDTAKTSAENLVFILNDILDINKIEAGKLEIEDLTFSIAEIIDNVVKVYIPVAQKKNITLNVIEDPEVPLYVKGDAIRVRQILFNLLGNALKFTNSSGKRLGVVNIEVTELEKNDFVSSVSFKVIDNGIGIDKQTQKTLFQPFIQAERSTTRKYGGTGLGLAICNKLSEMMGGRITLLSEPNVGSTFDVDIPFWKSQETRAMMVMELADLEINVVSFDDTQHTKIDYCIKHIEKAGASISLYTPSTLQTYAKSPHILLIIVDNIEQNKQTLMTLLGQNNNNKNVLIAANIEDIEHIKNDYKKMKIINMNQLTRTELINAILQVKQQTLDYEFEFDELELALELLSPIEDELDLNLDLTKLSTNPLSHKLPEKTLKEGILVVEDNELNQELITKQLKNIGYRCEVASNGQEGQEKWANGNYKIILTDCHMPIIDGYEMTKNIRQLEGEHTSPIPIIAITGAAMSGDADHCYQTGMNDFVSKPIQQSDLKNILSKWYPHE